MSDMLDIAIWGAGKIGQDCLMKLKNYIAKECNFYFVDSNSEKIGTQWCGYPVYGINVLSERKRVTKSFCGVVAVPETSFGDVGFKLAEWGLTEDFAYYNKCFTPTYILKKKIGTPILPYVETHLIDTCNLLCKGCGHLSNIAPYKKIDLDKFCTDFICLKKLFTDIRKIRLMGGEPFLNSSIYEYVKSVRDIWQDSDIRIVTNGILLDEGKIPLLEKLNKLGAKLDISAYPATVKRKDFIESIARRANIKYSFSKQVKEFMKFRNISGNNICEDAYDQCPIKECTFMRDGKLSNCSFPVLYSQLDTIMKDIFAFTDKDTVNLYDENINGWDVINHISRPISACRYCASDKLAFYQWEGYCGVDRAQVSDWLVG